jgi:short-subunit dehydrogenase
VSVSISGSRVLVTGATGGLGQAVARELARRGAQLVLTGRRADVLEPLAAELGAEVRAVDLADRSAVAALADASADVDALVANAALPGSGRLDSFSVEQIDRTIEVNLRAPMVLAHELVPHMVGRGRGALVFISSLSGKAAAPGSSLYTATKFGLRGFALALRIDLNGTGVGVTVVNPGFIREAGMFADSGAKLPPGVGTKTPQDVADGVVRALERSPAEIDVAPLGLRAGALVGGVAPGLAETIGRKLGSVAISEDMAAGQAAKR